MSQPPAKKLKVTSASIADQGPVAIIKAGPVKGPLRREKQGDQLATIRVPQPEAGVDGTPMTAEAKAERIESLKLCLEIQKEVEKASGVTAVKAAYREVEELVNTFKVVALARGRDLDYVKETFLRLTFSGLLRTCVDRALKPIEER